MSDTQGRRAPEPLTIDRLRQLLDALEEGVSVLGPEGVVEYVNPSGERILGVSADELLGWKLIDFRWEIVDEAGRPLPRESLPPLRVITTGEPQGPMIVGMSSPAVSGVRWVEVSARPLPGPGKRGPASTVTSFRDVSKRLEATRALRASEERYQTMAQSVPVGIFHTDAESGLVWANRMWTEITGLSLEDSLGTGWTRAVHPEDLPGLFEAWSAAVAAGQPYRREHRYVHPDGEVRWVICRATELTDGQGRYLGRVGSVTDVTEAKAAATMKDQVIGLVSHELRAPLVSIRGALTFLEPHVRDVEEDGQRLFRIAVRNAELLERMVRDLLDIERLEAGQLKLEKASVPVAELLARAIEVVRAQAEERGVVVRAPAPTTALVLADRDRVLQLLTNLLSNAVKFSEPDGEVRIDVRSGAGVVTVGIHDQGIGIAPEHHEHIFQPFTQVGDAARRGGAGLGLAISRAIAKGHGGRLWVESEAEKGASFFVSLPAG
jgi:PAS domain S-box-containing protein